MNFYIGSGMKNRELVNYYVKALKEFGWNHTYNWTDNVNKEITKKTLVAYAKSEFQGIIDSDVVIILLTAGRGTHIELGMALALNKLIYLCSSTEEEFNVDNTVAFYELLNITHLVGTADENL